MIMTDHFRYKHHLRDQLIFLISRHPVNVLLMIKLDTQGQVIELLVYIKTFISSISTLRNECYWFTFMVVTYGIDFYKNKTGNEKK